MQQQPPPYSKHTHTQLSEEGKKENRHGNQKGRGEGGASPSRRRRRRAAVASSSYHLAAAMAHRVKREESVPPRHCPTRRVSRPLPSRRREHRGERLRDCERGRSAEGRFCSYGRASLPQIAVQPSHHRATVIAMLGERNVAAAGSQEGKSSHEEGESCGEREAMRSVAPPQVSWSEEEAVPLCFDRREWFCDFRDHRWNFRPSLCHWRTSLPSPENSSVDPPELLAAARAAVGPVQNRSCFVLKFQAVYAAAKMCGAVL
ncbi:uncharacterized protein DS421_18g618150 [Arachis hypogaea]|nr:uncharacterized protein DS421_18g618150 [Arachis hypogaea]